MEGGIPWPPPESFSTDQVTVTDVPRDGNCLFYSLLRGDTKLKNVKILRKRLMHELAMMRHEECHDSSYTWEFLTMHAIEDRNKEAGNGWIHTTSFEEYIADMLHATPYAASTRWGGDHEILLYTRIYLQYVAVYHEVEGTYKRMFDYGFEGVTPRSTDNVHLLLLDCDHYKFLTLNTTNKKRKTNRNY